MKNIIGKVFEDHKYDIKELSNDILFSAIDSQEYYLTVQYNEQELADFFESEKTNHIIEQFEKLQSDREDIKKNTTLLVYVETNNIKEFYNEYKNIVFKIEEDEYFFRKHVIVYSKEGIKSINADHEISADIHRILLKEGKMEDFEEVYYENEEFFIAMQLMAKLPFLVFKHGNEDYESLIEKVNKWPAIMNMVSFTKWIDTKDSSDYFDQLKEEILSEDTETLQLNALFQRFEEIEL